MRPAQGDQAPPRPAHEPPSRTPPGPNPTRRTASGPGRPRPPQAARQEPGSLARIHSKRERRVAGIKWGILALVAILIIGLAVGHAVSKKSPSATKETGNTVPTSPASQPVTEGATATRSALQESTLLSVPAASAVAQGDGKSFVTDDKRNLLLRFDPATGKVQTSLSLLGRPDAMVFTGDDLWIAEMVSNEVIEVNPNTLKVVQVVNVPAGPSSLSVLNGDVWVTSVLANEITPIDMQTGVLGTPVQVLSGAVRATSGYNALWVSGTENLVTRIVPAPNNDGPPAQHALKVGQGPVGIAAGAGSVWVANSQDGTVSQVDPTSLEVTATLPVGPDPVAVVVTPDNHVYAGLGSAQTVRVVSPAPESKALGVKGEPRALLAVGTGSVWVATSNPGKVLAVS